MSRTRCPYCFEPFRANPALHVEVPYLAGPDDLTVVFCYDTGRHARIPLTWAEDLRRSLARLRRLFHALLRWS